MRKGRRGEFFMPVFQRRTERSLFPLDKSKRRSRTEVPVEEEVAGVTSLKRCTGTWL